MADLTDLILLAGINLLLEIKRLRLLLLLPRLQLPLPLPRRIRSQVPVSGHGMKSE
jgi:hypothetical protein